MQIFTRNQTRWDSKPISEQEAALFRKLRAETGIGPNMAHASYLVNLATEDPLLEARSVAAMVDEVRRAEQLSVEFLVFHPGAHMGAGVDRGVANIARRLDAIIEEAGSAGRVRILLENTAGQGSAIGHDLSHLRDILAACRFPDRLGVCIDTCHAFAAGYDFTTDDGYESFVSALDDAVGLRRVLAFHLNDSKKALASRVDRHEQIDEGLLTAAPIVRFVRDPRFADRPGTLETPLAEERYAQELKLLRKLAGAKTRK
jgi:deoxyribonuclease-4